MAKESKIQWTDATWNPVRGCRKVSQGCKYCYAERLIKGRWKLPFDKITRAHDKTFYEPMTWRGPKLIFTCSLSDFFIEEADRFRPEMYKIMFETPQHIYQVLTKRPERVLEGNSHGYLRTFPENMMLGVSVENQEMWEKRVPLLTQIKSKFQDLKTFLSIEPLLEPVHLKLNREDPLKPDWIVVGGESGFKEGKWQYRPCELEWIIGVVRQAQAAGIAVFVKQLGTHIARELGLAGFHGGDPIAELPGQNDWPKEVQIREYPEMFNKIVN